MTEHGLFAECWEPAVITLESFVVYRTNLPPSPPNGFQTVLFLFFDGGMEIEIQTVFCRTLGSSEQIK
jgi:hypothetical protein